MTKITTLLLASLLLAPGFRPGQDRSIAEVFDGVNSSVVTIRASSFDARESPTSAPSGNMTVGSGVLVSPSGNVVTAAHVVQVANEIQVEFADGTMRPADVVAMDSVSDLALLQVLGDVPSTASVATLGDSDEARVGDQILVIGAPLDIDHTLTVGYISGRRKDESFLGSMQHIEHFQTDAAINMGNSGGPMFNLRGQVIGIVCHIISETGGSEGLGFALTSNAVRELLLDREHFWIGVTSVPLPEVLARALNVPEGRLGLLVQRVAHGSPAQKMGIRGGSIPAKIGGAEILLGGDILLELQGVPLGAVQHMEHLKAALREVRPGTELRAKVLREGVLRDVRTLLPR